MTTTRYATAVGIVTLMLITTGCQQQLPQPLLDDVNAVRATNFDSACINVTRQVDAKRITMFAIVPVDPSTKEIGGYHIEVVVNPTIIREHRKFCGAYHNHHNGLVLNFAAVQVLEGDRDLGLYLIRTLAKIDPTTKNLILGNGIDRSSGFSTGPKRTMAVCRTSWRMRSSSGRIE